MGIGNQKWLNSDYIMKIDYTGFGNESDVECNRKRPFQDATQIFVLINEKHMLAEMGKTRSTLGRDGCREIRNSVLDKLTWKC